MGEGSPTAGIELLTDEEGKNTKTFSKSHGDNAKSQDVTKGTWIATDSFNSLGTDETHANSSACTANGLSDVAGDAGSDGVCAV